ncbi:DUF669 domain-containing protein [Roseicella sp. DB1501]|uniref:DUF669 domain-containing protein n=1 Tax=Roseicella sp. DB1501 TaxID=2730925 RepID=UPI0014918B50|nr:DUF669 domain-containing protein [Roseicella sp. DB1501]NOG73738.1 DUF669 domain-containing protein [Roseicella sp. DB1501]
MVQFASPINANDIPERSDYTPVPPATYTAMITASEEKQNGPNSKDPTGSQVVLTVEIVDGEYTGRKIFERLNLNNASEDARKIAFETLGEITRAVGRTTVSRSEDLHDRRMLIDVTVTPAKGDYGPGNRIKKYRALSNTPSAAAPASGAAAATSAAPWAAARK